MSCSTTTRYVILIWVWFFSFLFCLTLKQTYVSLTLQEEIKNLGKKIEEVNGRVTGIGASSYIVVRVVQGLLRKVVRAEAMAAEALKAVDELRRARGTRGNDDNDDNDNNNGGGGGNNGNGNGKRGPGRPKKIKENEGKRQRLQVSAA